MQTIRESRLTFDCDDDWTVIKWDEQPAYRESGAFGSLPRTRACDIVGCHPSGGVYLIEVKNYTSFHHANRDRLRSGALLDVVVAKVRDTIAGAVWTRGRAYDVKPVDAILDQALKALFVRNPPLHVVLWLEDLPPLGPMQASAMQQSLRRALLRQFNVRSVMVASCDVAVRDALPGLSVRPTP